MSADPDPELIAPDARRRRIARYVLVAIAIALASVGLWRLDEYRLSRMTLDEAYAAYDRATDRPMLKYWYLHSAYRVFDRLAKVGDPNAQYMLANMYRDGDYVGYDGQSPLDLWTRASDQGHTSAMNRIAEYHGRSYRVEESVEEAVRWFRRSAELGNGYGQARLGRAYLRGWGIDQDIAVGRQWLERAIEETDNRSAKFFLGQAYRDGLFGEPDYESALYWCLEGGKDGLLYSMRASIHLLSDERMPFFDIETAYQWAWVTEQWWGDLGDRRFVLLGTLPSLLHMDDLPGLTPRPPPASGIRPLRIGAAAQARGQLRAEAILDCWPEPPITREISVVECLMQHGVR